jgi:hypothetical protein
MKLNTVGANGTARPISLVILMLDALKQSLVLMCLHVNITGITVVTVNYLVLLNTFDMSINDTTAVIIQYQINTRISNDILVVQRTYVLKYYINRSNIHQKRKG